MEKYMETATELVQRGYDIFTFDWRGQGISARMLPNRHKGYVDTYDTYLKDLELFIRTIVKPEGTPPFIILSHSMSGVVTLHYLYKHRGIISKAVLTSPMFGILTFPYPVRFAKFFTRFAVHNGRGSSYVPGSGDYDPSKPEFKGNRLTSDPKRFLTADRAIVKNPDLALGGVTHRWLYESFQSMDMLYQPGYVEQIRTPILILGAGTDRVVSNRAQKEISLRLPDCRRVEITGAKHEILMETDAIRTKFRNAFDEFVEPQLSVRPKHP